MYAFATRCMLTQVDSMPTQVDGMPTEVDGMPTQITVWNVCLHNNTLTWWLLGAL